MGFISRTLVPACGNMCVCYPALNPSSRRPVKRYKKLLAEIFPKNLDDPPNERKIMKLCEYAAKNPLRIPKIAKYLEQRSYKEIQSGHINSVKIITEAYIKLLYICKEQMAYFAISLLNVIAQLVDGKQQDSLRILGCHTLAKFIYSQADNTYTRNIEILVLNVCAMARVFGEEEKRLLRASSLHCLSAMIWLMCEYSFIFGDLDEIIYVILENYRTEDADNTVRCESHNWVDEVVRCETGGVAVSNDASPSNMAIRPRPEIKDPAMLSREEREFPEVWSQICLHRLADLTNESTTLRRVLEPMLIYFDQGRHWPPRNGLALLVLSDLSFSKKNSGNQHLILSAIIRHLDHKNVIYSPKIKSDIVQVATTFVRQLRSQTIITEVGVITDLCRHLRKSLQATVESAGLQETNSNESLRNSIEDCLLEIIRGIADQHLIFDMMAITLEKLSMVAIVSRATIGSLLILAHIISLTSPRSDSQAFPEALLVQLLKAMLHPDVETRTGAHQIFALILGRAPSHARKESEYLFETKKWQSRTTSVFASATALLEKLRREKESLNIDKHESASLDQGKSRQTEDEELRISSIQKSTCYSSKLVSSVIDRIAASTSLSDKDTTSITQLTEDQVAQLISGFWIQAIRTDNEPADYVAIANSFSLTLLSSRVKNSNQRSIVRTFQLLLSLRKASLDPKGLLPFSCQQSLFTFTTGLLEFAGRLYYICGLPDLCKLITSSEIDPYLRVGEDLQIYLRSESDISNYGSESDQLNAKSTLSNLRNIVSENDQLLLDALISKLSTFTGFDKDDLAKQLTERFMPEDTSLFGLNPALDWVVPEAPEDSASLDWECSRRSSMDCDAVGHSPAFEIPRFSSAMSAQPILSNVISVGQLLESALHVAGQVAGTSVSTSPLPYVTMASQCEALGMGARKKLSSWLISGHDRLPETPMLNETVNNHNFLQKANPCSFEQAYLCAEPWLALRLPPASPFDNFMKAAGC